MVHEIVLLNLWTIIKKNKKQEEQENIKQRADTMNTTGTAARERRAVVDGQ